MLEKRDNSGKVWGRRGRKEGGVVTGVEEEIGKVVEEGGRNGGRGLESS